MKNILKHFHGLMFVFAIIFSTTAFSATISSVKGKKVIISLDGDTLKKGEILYIVDSNGKKKGLVKIMSIKGSRALGKVGKGKAKAGFRLLAKSNDSKPKSSTEAESSAASSNSSTMGWGLLLGFGMDTMKAELENSEVAELSGTGMSYKFMFDYAMFEKVWFRGTLGIENFDTENDKALTGCGSVVCTVKIQYMTLDFWGRYLFSLSTFRPWIGGGFSLWFPMSNTTTALNEDSITNTSVMGLGGGFDWFVSPKFYIPFQVEYGMLPASEQVTASTLTFRFGFGMSF